MPFQMNTMAESLQKTLVHLPSCGHAVSLTDYGPRGGLKWSAELYLVVTVQLLNYGSEVGVIPGEGIEVP